MPLENITALNSPTEANVEYGTVHAEQGGRFEIHSPTGVFHARRAFSCVVNPEAGDRVMISRDDKQLCHVLAIIERPTHQHSTLAFDGDVTIASPQGNLSLSGRQGVQLTSTQSVTLLSSEVDVMADKGLMNISDLTMTGDQVNSHFSSVRTFAKSIDTVAERLTQKLKHSFRLIEGMDQTTAGEMLTSIKNLFSLRARQSAILAKKDIKIDAERIHMG